MNGGIEAKPEMLLISSLNFPSLGQHLPILTVIMSQTSCRAVLAPAAGWLPVRSFGGEGNSPKFVLSFPSSLHPLFITMTQNKEGENLDRGRRNEENKKQT